MVIHPTANCLLRELSEFVWVRISTSLIINVYKIVPWKIRDYHWYHRRWINLKIALYLSCYVDFWINLLDIHLSSDQYSLSAGMVFNTIIIVTPRKDFNSSTVTYFHFLSGFNFTIQSTYFNYQQLPKLGGVLIYRNNRLPYSYENLVQW